MICRRFASDSRHRCPGSRQAGERIAWRSASKKEAGIEFVGLSDEVRDQIDTWISWMGAPIGFPNTRESFERAEQFEKRKTSSETGRTSPELPEKQSKRSFFPFVRSPAETLDARSTLKKAGDENNTGVFSNAFLRVGLSVTA